MGVCDVMLLFLYKEQPKSWGEIRNTPINFKEMLQYVGVQPFAFLGLQAVKWNCLGP